METMSWFGALGPAFAPYFALVCALMIVSGIVGLLLSMSNSRPSQAFFIIAAFGMAVILILGLWLSYTWIMTGASEDFLRATGITRTVLSIVTVVGLFAALSAWVMRRWFEHPAATMWSFFGWSATTLLVLVLLWLVSTYLWTGANERGIVAIAIGRFMPVWIALAVLFTVSIMTKQKTGLYGKLFDSTVGMIGLGLVMFWVFTGVFAAMDLIVTHDPLSQVSGMKNKVPGTFFPDGSDVYLLGGDNLARDVFSRMVVGSWEVIKIAPFATMFAFMAGITLGLPAGYFGGRFDTILSFIANLILAFPVILLFYLLVTPEIVATGIPRYMAAVMFLFPILFLIVMMNSRFYTQPKKRNVYVIATLIIGGWLYLGIAWDADPLGIVNIDPGLLVVFVSVVFVNSPTVFRIVRGLTLDIQTRDYVAAAQTRGEGAWYIMLWEILPNARGPLLVDFCLRIGYTTILLGTLGFFGLGLSPESPDWGSTINDGRRLLGIYPHPALAPALSLMSLVLGLNLLADGLREQSLKD